MFPAVWSINDAITMDTPAYEGVVLSLPPNEFLLNVWIVAISLDFLLKNVKESLRFFKTISRES